MTYESRFSQWRPVFRETFESEQTTRNLFWGEPTDVSYGDGKGTFNGTSSFVNIDNILSQLEWTDTGTWKVNFNSNLLTWNRMLASFWGYDNWSFIWLFTEGAGKIRAIAAINGSSSWALKTDLPIETNKDISLHLVQDWIEPIIFVDWVEVDITFDTDTDKSLWFSWIDNIDNWRIWSLNRNSLWDDLYFSWQINLIEIYDHAWTAEQVANDYNNVTYRDVKTDLILDIDSRQGVIEDRLWSELVVKPLVTTQRTGIYDSINFNNPSWTSSDSYIETESITRTKAVSVVCEVSFNSIDPVNWAWIISQRDAGANDQFQLALLAGVMYAAIWHDDLSAIAATFPFSPDLLKRYTVSFSTGGETGSELNIYLDWVKQATETLTRDANVASLPIHLWIRSWTIATPPIIGSLNGNIYSAKVYNWALTDQEMTQLYTNQYS